MAKELVKLSLRDMYAIKHALQNIVRRKSEKLEYLCTEATIDGEIGKEINSLNKDLAHEKALIEKFEEEISDFKDKYGLLGGSNGTTANNG